MRALIFCIKNRLIFRLIFSTLSTDEQKIFKLECQPFFCFQFFSRKLEKFFFFIKNFFYFRKKFFYRQIKK